MSGSTCPGSTPPARTSTWPARPSRRSPSSSSGQLRRHRSPRHAVPDPPRPRGRRVRVATRPDRRRLRHQPAARGQRPAADLQPVRHPGRRGGVGGDVRRRRRGRARLHHGPVDAPARRRVAGRRLPRVHAGHDPRRQRTPGNESGQCSAKSATTSATTPQTFFTRSAPSQPAGYRTRVRQNRASPSNSRLRKTTGKHPEYGAPADAARAAAGAGRRTPPT